MSPSSLKEMILHSDESFCDNGSNIFWDQNDEPLDQTSARSDQYKQLDLTLVHFSSLDIA